MLVGWSRLEFCPDFDAVLAVLPMGGVQKVLELYSFWRDAAIVLGRSDVLSCGREP